MNNKDLDKAWDDFVKSQGISKDRRTKEFKQFKKRFAETPIEYLTEEPEDRSEGLGDTIEKITKATGIKKVVEFFNEGKPCAACEERKQKWNSMFRYKKPKELTEEEFYTLYDFFMQDKNSITDSEQRHLLVIYNRVFSAKKTFSRCKPCVRGMIQQLEKIYEQY